MYLIKSKSGFTLIELLLGAGLSALIGIALMSTFAAGLKAYDKVKNDSGPQADILLSLEKMEKDLRNSFVYSGIAFKADAQRMSFPSFVTTGNTETLGQVSYAFDPITGNLTRQQMPYPASTQATPELLATVKEFNLSYASFNTETKKYAWGSSWDQAQIAFKAVKIKVVLKGKNEDIQLDRTVLLPTGV